MFASLNRRVLTEVIFVDSMGWNLGPIDSGKGGRSTTSNWRTMFVTGMRDGGEVKCSSRPSMERSSIFSFKFIAPTFLISIWIRPIVS